MIKKLKPVHAHAVVETRRPFGLFYVYENGVYIGIDNSAGHAWVEEFGSLRKCKEWLRNPSVPVPSMEEEESGMSQITRPEELMDAAMLQGIDLDASEADMILGYLEGHDYCLMTDKEGWTLRHDEQDGKYHRGDIPYPIQDAVMFCREMNGELLEENESQSSSDIAYLEHLRKDEQVLDKLVERINAASGQYMEAASCLENIAYPAA